MGWQATIERYFLNAPYGRPEQWPEGWRWIGEHLFYTGVAVSIAILIAVPLGLSLTRVRRLAAPVLWTSSLAQTIPALAMIVLLFVLVDPLNAILPSFMRIQKLGPVPSLVALVVYALLPILRNTYTGVEQVDPAVREAAYGMGLSGRQVLMRVELPLALPVIMAGIRTATVWTVGIATICGLVGAGGLGTPIFQGLRVYDNGLLLVGVLPAMALALLLDASFALAEKWLTPRGLTLGAQRNR